MFPWLQYQADFHCVETYSCTSRFFVLGDIQALLEGPSADCPVYLAIKPYIILPWLFVQLFRYALISRVQKDSG